jgi:hypothetical protein
MESPDSDSKYVNITDVSETQCPQKWYSTAQLLQIII